MSRPLALVISMMTLSSGVTIAQELNITPSGDTVDVVANTSGTIVTFTM